MKHRILSLFAALVCAVGTASASWMPSEHYCTFCDNFKFDHAFQFYSAGSQNNGKKTEEMAVQFQECHGVIAFSLMTWDRRMLAQTTNWGMTWVEVYLTGGPNDIRISKIYFTSPKKGSGESTTYNEECNYSSADTINGCKTYFLQKRQYEDYDRCQFSYFNITYSQVVYNYIHDNRGSLGMRLRLCWDGGTYDYRYAFQSGEKGDIMERTSNPVLDNFQWTKSSDGKTVLRYTAGEVFNSIYHERVTGGAVPSTKTSLTTTYTSMLNRERTDVADLTRQELNLFGKDNSPYVIEVARQPLTNLSSSYYDIKHSGPSSPFAGPQSDWKKVYVPALFLPEDVTLSHDGGDSIYASFMIPRKSYGRDEDESAIVIEYSTEENFGSFETERVDFNTTNRLVNTSYKVGLPIPTKMLNQGRKVFYVRMSREFVDHATTCVKEQILINTDLRKIASVAAEDAEGKIHVSWTHVGDYKGIWTSDMFYRVQYVVDGTTYQKEYADRNLTSVDLTEGIPTCQPIEYTVQVCTAMRTVSSMTSAPIGMASTRGAVISSLTATKGDSNNRVRLQWTVPKDRNDFSYFTITRAERGDSVAITLVPQMAMNKSLTTFTYEDNSMELGTYYNYTVTGYRECDGSISPMSSLTETGFALPFGVVTGQITYDGRQGVPGVLVTAMTDEEVPYPQKAVADTLMKEQTLTFRALVPSNVNYIQGPKYTGDYGSVQFWVRDLGSGGHGQLFFMPRRIAIALTIDAAIKVQGRSSKDAFLSNPIATNEWTHVAVSYTPDSFYVYLNGQMAGRKKYQPVPLNDFIVGSGGAKGYELADIRLYNYCMDAAEISSTAMQIPLKGNETGLELYYSACEEGNEVHDLSGHGRDLKISGLSFNRLSETVEMPAGVVYRTVNDSTRANYTAYTKSDGTYVITGIPYREAGTYYKIVPTLGTHEFAPANRPLYFNNNTNTHNNVNFTDMTSVRVSGAIYYEGTDYPVDGALLSVDGVACVVGGVPVLTNADGQFSILVPMGNHYITATKSGHTFASNGRYPEDPNNVGKTYEFLHDVNDLMFYDNTKLLLVGRVAGGDEELHKPHGMHLGKANIGRAVITLQASDIYSLNTDSVERVWAQPTDSIVAAGRVVTAASGTDLSHNVVIYTDSVTGEFTASLPPLTYKVKSIVIPSNDEYRFNPLSYNPIELGAYAGSMRMQDSLKLDSSTVHRVRYHLAFDAPYYVEPVLTVTDAGRTDLAFGEEWVNWQDEKDKLHMVPSFTVDSVTGKPDYRMTYPLFRQGSAYRWRLKITETYVNKDDAANPVTTVLPWKNGIVTVKNNLGNRIAAERDTIMPMGDDSTTMVNYKKGETIALGENQIALDSTGMGIYQFRASAPNITKPYTLGVDMSYTNVYGTRNYGWTENGKFYGVVLGSISNGSDIQTNGPDDVLYILRNAPGANSSVAATEGTTFTRTSNSSTNVNWMGMANFQFGVGEETAVFNDAGVATFGLVSIMQLGEGLHLSPGAFYMGSKSWANNSTSVNTLTQTISTTPGSEGAGGDVFVGQATNDVFSNSRRVGIQRDPNDSTHYYIGDFDSYVVGKSFGTQFAYTQTHIENKLIPDFLRARNALLEHADAATIAQYRRDSTGLVNTTDKMKYFTSLTPNDAAYGVDSTVVAVPPQIDADGKLHVEKNMVKHYNEQIKTWKQLLAHNEKMKVLCQQRSGEFNKDQYEAAIQKVMRVREVMNTLQEARNKMTAIEQYNIDSLKAFDSETTFGDGKMYQGFSKGEVQRLLKTYNDNKKIKEDQYNILKNEELDTTRTQISDYYGGGYLMKNISLSPGTSMVLNNTKALSHGESITTTHSADVSMGVGLGAVTPIAKFTFDFNADAGVGVNSANGTDTNETFATNITLASNATSSMSFDMYAAPDGFAPIFFVRGGATSCPYIDEERTKYFEPGRHVLTTSTAAIDKPYLYLRQGSSSMQNDLPVGASAYFTLGMTNQSAVSGAAGTYKLRPVDKHTGEELGAVLEVNGAPLTSAGITYMLAAGDSIFVPLRVYQSNPEVMRYDSIGIELLSDCDPTRSSTIWLSVNYRYSCSDINLTLDNTLLNTQTKSILGKDTVELSGEISGLLPQYSALYGVRLQYKRGEGEWSTMRTWRKGITVRDSEGNYPMPEAEHFRFSIPMSDKDYADGTYQVRAVTVCKPAAEEEVCKESETFTVIKDVARPEPITIPSPADGILRNDNTISVTFNKDIQPARVLATNISVTGELNGHDLRHSVALQLSGQKAATQATLRLGTSDFTIETWLNYSEAGELMNIGEDKFRLSLTDDGKLAIQIDTVTITSSVALPKNKWVFLALSYQQSTVSRQLNASMAYDDVTSPLIINEAVPGVNTKAALQIGGGTAVGMIHDLTIWSQARDMTTSLSERSRTKVPYTPALTAYWPMDEGYGKTAIERVHARHITTGNNAWWIAGDNYAAVLDGSNALRVPVSELGIGAEDDYALDCWVNTTTDGTILSLGDTVLALAIENGKLALTANGTKRSLASFASGTWHYVALNVRRSGMTSVILDENIVLQETNANTIPTMGGDYLTIGKGLSGAFDELRISRVSLTNELLILASHFRLHGNETGLVAYYPFEKDSIDSGNQHQTAPTLEDRCANALNKQSAEWSGAQGQMTDTNHPALIEARAVEAVPFTFTASDRQINISLNDQQMAPARVEGCNLRVEVKNIVDEHDNYAAPVCWNMYVQRNTLLWKDNYASVTKHELDEQQLALTIVNTGSEVQNWSITNIPLWLQLNATAGVIAPQSELPLTATLPASLAAGYYTGILLLTGKDGIAEPCIVEASVLATEPEWKVNEGAYESTGNIIARLSLPAGVAQSENDIIAAFTGNECVGIAHPQYINAYDAWYVMMTVYGNAEANANLQFRLWNAETGITYASVNVLPAPFRFTPNMVRGTLSDPVVLEVTDRLQQTLALQPAWNWISLSIRPVSAKTENVFAPVLGDITEVKSKSQFFQVNTADTTYAGSLKTMNVTSSYRVNALRQTILNIDGTAVNCAETPVTVRKGWNWIGYLPLQTMPVGDALADIEPVTGDLIKSKTAFAVYDGAQWIGTLNRMTPGEGYMYLSHTTDILTFRYPEVSVVRSMSAPRALRADSRENVFTPVTDPYSGNMSIVARVKDGEETVHGVEVGIFAGEECRGAATEDEGDYWFITVAGDDPTPLTIRIYNPATGQTVVAAQTLDYADDATLGTLAEPYIIQLNATDGVEEVLSDEVANTKPRKFIEDGIVYILKPDGTVYSAPGARVK